MPGFFFSEKEEFLLDDDDNKTHGDCSLEFYHQLTSVFCNSGKCFYLPYVSSGTLFYVSSWHTSITDSELSENSDTQHSV